MHLLLSIDHTNLGDIADAEALLRSLRDSGRNGSAASDDANDALFSAMATDGDASTVGNISDAEERTTLKDEDWDYALELLFTVGRERQGSLTLFKQALTYAPRQGYTYAEIADDIGLEEAEAKAFRRNLGRALNWIERDELPGMPDLFRSWKDKGAWRYEVIDEVRAAAKRRGLI